MVEVEDPAPPEEDPDFAHDNDIDTMVPSATHFATDFKHRIKSIPLISKRKSDICKITEGLGGGDGQKSYNTMNLLYFFFNIAIFGRQRMDDMVEPKPNGHAVRNKPKPKDDQENRDNCRNPHRIQVRQTVQKKGAKATTGQSQCGVTHHPRRAREVAWFTLVNVIADLATGSKIKPRSLCPQRR
jgi:hypothetical protein